MSDENEIIPAENAVIETIDPTQELISTNFKIVSISDVPSLGAIGSAIHNFVGSQSKVGGEGIYKVTFPGGFDGTLSKFKNENAFLGSGISNEKMAQARLTQVHFDPTQMFIAFALMGIQYQLGEIQATQQEILNFLANQEESKLKGYLTTLNDAIEECQINWNNKDFVEQKKKEISQIKTGVNSSENFYKKEIEDILSTPNLPHTMSKANKVIQKLIRDIRDYHLAFYVKNYTMYFETILTENFSKENLGLISDRFQKNTDDYLQLIKHTKDWISDYLGSSIDYAFGRVYRWADSVCEKASHKIPADVDKIYTNDKEKYVSKETQMERIEQDEDPGITMFSKSMFKIETLHDRQVVFYVEGDNVYLPEDTLGIERSEGDK
ncbi:hypothetical protein [Pseudoramibacter faecis]|uniref:hypothetical protein n=1 Tax=Pseudoramibacter faecis TaxID=3108534 RepID=UPI002E7A3B09|nr:hypothetical protein [Pseudoramibacter sp. HA2172]